ncbi:MAG: hypothetical protein ABIL70_01425 [candidate division WOR-3 bacterium]
MKKKILLVCSRNSPGPMKVIKNLQGVVNQYIQADCINIEDFLIPRFHFKSKILNYKYLRMQEYLNLLRLDRISEYGDNIFLVAWGALYDVLLKRLNRRGVKPSLIMCSTIGQSDFNDLDRLYMLQVIDNVMKGRVKDFLLNKRLYMSLGKILPRAIYFPHPVDLSQFSSIIPQKLPGINIDIFVSLRPGKNIMNQIFAVKISSIDCVLHINFRNPQIERFIKTLSLQTKVHSWIPDSEYYNLVAGMTLSLQVTFTESFSYAVCERMCLSVPTITSYDIDLISEDRFLSKYLCVEGLDTPTQIAERLKKIVGDDKLREELSIRCRERINKIAQENNRIVKEYFSINI